MYGKLRVTLKRMESYGDLVEMKLELVESGRKSGQASQPRIVTLLQLTSWPLHGEPHPSAVLSLIDKLSLAQRSSSGKHTVVMCRLVDHDLKSHSSSTS